MKPYDAIPFTNEFDQVINPGDTCIVITKGRSGSISRYRGRYLGVRSYTTYYQKEPRYQVVAEVEDTEGGYWHPVTDEKLSWNNDLGVKYSTRPCTRITSLWLNHIFPSTFA